MSFTRVAHILEKIKTKTKTKSLTKCTQFNAPKGANCWACGRTSPTHVAHKVGADFGWPELTGGEVPFDGMSTSVLPIIPRIYLGGSQLRRRALGTRRRLWFPDGAQHRASVEDWLILAGAWPVCMRRSTKVLARWPRSRVWVRRATSRLARQWQ